MNFHLLLRLYAKLVIIMIFCSFTYRAEAQTVRETSLINLQSSIDYGAWSDSPAIYPLKGQEVALKVDLVNATCIRWYRIIPDTSRMYKNANFPWEDNAYKWVGFAKIRYSRHEIVEARDKLQYTVITANDSGSGLTGSYWYQVEVEKDGEVGRSAGLKESDHRGLSPQVFRVSIRDGEGFLGYVSSFFNVPGVFGSATYQSTNYIGTDCADVMMAAYSRWRNIPLNKNYNVAMLVSEWPKVDEFNLRRGGPSKKVEWGKDVLPGDAIAVRYKGSRQYQHVGALHSDRNGNGLLDKNDIIIHAGPQPLHYSPISDGSFEGHVVVLRPEDLSNQAH